MTIDLASLHETLPDSDRHALVAARQAWTDIRTGLPFSQWMLIADALMIGRRLIMRALKLNNPKGRSYNEAFSQWCGDNGFGDMPNDTRSYLLYLAEPENRAILTRLRDSMTAKEHERTLHPQAMWRRVRAEQKREDAERRPASPKAGSPDAASAPAGTLAAAHNEIARLKAELAAKAKIEPATKSATEKPLQTAEMAYFEGLKRTIAHQKKELARVKKENDELRQKERTLAAQIDQAKVPSLDEHIKELTERVASLDDKLKEERRDWTAHKRKLIKQRDELQDKFDRIVPRAASSVKLMMPKSLHGRIVKCIHPDAIEGIIEASRRNEDEVLIKKPYSDLTRDFVALNRYLYDGNEP